MATSIKLPIVDLKGKAAGEMEAPANMFAVEPNESVVHFVCEGQRFRFYKKTATTKGRAQVSGGGKKSIKQKGSGGARHGGKRAPIFVGGGVVFGPKGIKRDFKINKKLYKIALASVLSDRHSGGQVRVLKEADLKAPKTKTFADFVKSLSIKGARIGFVVSRKGDDAVAKSVRNLRNVDLLTEEHWTTLDFVKTDSLVFSESALKELSSRFKA